MTATFVNPIDAARLRQRDAAEPSTSVWVSASAGTGKTRVLIDRVLRLLLPREDGALGTRPDRILCLTYTRAAAAEMTARLLDQVSGWATMPEEQLEGALLDLFGKTPRPDQKTAARGLFTRLVDGPDTVRVQTIHSFCQSILARFPLEAGIPPHFRLIEEMESTALLARARAHVMNAARHDPDLAAAMHDVLAALSDEGLTDLLAALFMEKRQLIAALNDVAAPDRRAVFYAGLGLDPDDHAARVQDEMAAFAASRRVDLQTLIAAMVAPPATATEMDLADTMARAMAATEGLRAFEALRPAFLKKDGGMQSPRRHQGVRKKDPGIADLYEKIAGDFVAILSRQQLLELAHLNLSLFHVIEKIVAIYDQLKRGCGVLDFDDVIRYTVRLLTHSPSGLAADSILSWVMYKLDGGIDHVLVDEAQDTNPQQWQIIRALTASFFDDVGARARCDRTLFVVGDQKQSIYSFQGADPRSFEESLHHLRQNAQGLSAHVFNRIPLNTSFRSGAAVLHLVDHVFDDPGLRECLREEGPITHVISRIGQGGRVGLWPLITAPAEDDAKTSGWLMPVTIRRARDAADLLARRIADHIAELLASGAMLDSRGRAITPRDIMILVRRRAPLLPRLVAALHARGVPTSGTDRLDVRDALLVCDVLALARFAVAPDDDLNLACVLKGPMIGYHDDDLIALAPGRPGSLWQAVQNDPARENVAAYLQEVLGQAQLLHPHGFLSWILQTPCPSEPAGSAMTACRAALGDDGLEPLDGLMALVYTHEQNGLDLLAILHELAANGAEIKREGDDGRDVVRLMTVHGSKGLEAPIVILPDTLMPARAARPMTLFWPDDTGLRLPIWSPRSKDRPPALQDVCARAEAAEAAEYNRLLYVALTRAQDHLIIAGAATSTPDPDKNHWYYRVRAGFERMRDLPGMTIVGEGDQVSYQYDVPQTAAPQGKRVPQTFTDGAEVVADAPACLSQPMPPEPPLPRPYRAMAVTGLPIPQSPLSARIDPARFARGLIVHKLLQVLPQVQDPLRDAIARQFVAAHGADFDPTAQAKIAADVMAILRHPDLPDLFSPRSRAEVPVTGLLPDGRLLSGQIDRLLITPDQVLIVDYKTGAAARAPDQVPLPYLYQLAAYQTLLARIYPDRPVRAALIWTDGPVYMDLTDHLGAAGLESLGHSSHIEDRITKTAKG